MPLIVPKITKDLEAAILNELKSAFEKGGEADSSAHQKIASAVAKAVAQVLIAALTTDAQVQPQISRCG